MPDGQNVDSSDDGWEQAHNDVVQGDPYAVHSNSDSDSEDCALLITSNDSTQAQQGLQGQQARQQQVAQPKAIIQRINTKQFYVGVAMVIAWCGVMAGTTHGFDSAPKALNISMVVWGMIVATIVTGTTVVMLKATNRAKLLKTAQSNTSTGYFRPLGY